jgi:quinol monooxygenase YgiN
MSISFMAALGGTLLAAVGTIVAVVRFARAPRADLIAWALATAGLTVALAAQTLGYRRGFDPAMFRAVQIGAQLVAPLALAWGIVEVAARSLPGRFIARLALSALFAVSAVILSIDPLAAQPFGLSWPAASAHYQFPSSELLPLIAAVAVVTAVVGVIVAGVRARGNRAWRAGFVAVGVAALATFATEGLAAHLPANTGYPALTLLAAVLAVLASVLAGRFRPAALRAVAGSGGEADWDPAVQGARDSGRYGADDSLGLYRDSGQGRYPAGVGGYGGAGGYGGYGDADYGGPDADYEGPVTGAFEGPVTGEFGRSVRGGFEGPDTGGFDGPVTGAFEAPVTGAFEALPIRGFEGPDTGSFDGPVTGAFDPIYQGGSLAGPSADEPAEEFDLARLYGQIAIYTLLEHGAAEFDRLAEQVVEQVRAHEPDALVYVVHGVPSAPLQRILYEVYTDQAAYDDHSRQSYVREFEVGRLPLVLATNVIELGVRQAKVSPLGPPSLRRSLSGSQSGPLASGPSSPGSRSAPPRSTGLPLPGPPLPGLPLPEPPRPGSRSSGPRSSGPPLSGPPLPGPRSSEPPSSDPWSSEPRSSEPPSSDPWSSEPRSSEPPSSDPWSSERRSSEPPSSDPWSSEPRSPEPRLPEAQSSEPRSSDPWSSEPRLSGLPYGTTPGGTTRDGRSSGGQAS